MRLIVQSLSLYGGARRCCRTVTTYDNCLLHYLRSTRSCNSTAQSLPVGKRRCDGWESLRYAQIRTGSLEEIEFCALFLEAHARWRDSIGRGLFWGCSFCRYRQKRIHKQNKKKVLTGLGFEPATSGTGVKRLTAEL